MSAKGYAGSFGLAAFGDRRGVAAVDAGRGGEAPGGALEATSRILVAVSCELVKL